MYLTIPVGGPARLHHGHVHDMRVISDELGGAMPLTLWMKRVPLGMHLREDCAGLDRNRLAGLLFTSLSGSALPILGPVVITRAEPTQPSGDGITTIGAIGCLPEEVAHMVTDMALQLWLALQHLDDQIVIHPTSVFTAADWAWAVRAGADKLDAQPLRDGYPYYRRPPPDRVAEGLARAGIIVRRGPGAHDLI